MKRSLFFYSYLLISLLSFNSCHLYHTPNIATINLSDEVKQYALFKKDSKWIYQDDSTKTTDTLSVVNSITYEIRNHIDDDVTTYWRGEICFHSSKEGYKFMGNTFYHDSISHYWFLSEGSVAYVDSASQNTELNKFILYPGYFNDATFQLSRTTLSNFLVNGVNYSNVIKIYRDNKKTPNTPDYKALEYYWAKNIGIIKKVFYDGTTVKSWSLIGKVVYQ